MQKTKSSASKRRYFKRYWSEVITRFNKDWSIRDCYYFEVGADNYAIKQIVHRYDGFVFKYDETKLDDKDGGLAEGALLLDETEYLPITKDAFYAIWDAPHTNQFSIKNLAFDEHWRMAWYNLNVDTTEAQLKAQELIICGTYKDIFLFELGYNLPSEFYFLQINEGSALITYTTTTEWDEAAQSAQVWIDRLQAAANSVYSQIDSEKLNRPTKVLVDGTQQDATFSTWRNMDWGVEKFRGAHLKINDTTHSKVNTYISMEDLLSELQASLPPNIHMQNCFFCRYSNYKVAGNDNDGDLYCFKHCKQKCTKCKNKHDFIDLFETEAGQYIKVEETFYCDEFEILQPTDVNYKFTKP
jgi:hypothetical protein